MSYAMYILLMRKYIQIEAFRRLDTLTCQTFDRHFITKDRLIFELGTNRRTQRSVSAYSRKVVHP